MQKECLVVSGLQASKPRICLMSIWLFFFASLTAFRENLITACGVFDVWYRMVWFSAKRYICYISIDRFTITSWNGSNVMIRYLSLFCYYSFIRAKFDHLCCPKQPLVIHDLNSSPAAPLLHQCLLAV